MQPSRISIRALALNLIKIYQRVGSPLLGSRCRFNPTCSWYAYDAIKKYGLIWGGLLTLKRILRCHPFTTGGHDPVP